MQNTSDRPAMATARSGKQTDVAGPASGEPRLRLKLELLEERIAPYVVKLVDKMSPR